MSINKPFLTNIIRQAESENKVITYYFKLKYNISSYMFKCAFTLSEIISK